MVAQIRAHTWRHLKWKQCKKQLGTELKWSKTASRPKLSKLVECGLEWSQMVQYDRNSPNDPKHSKLVQRGLKWIFEGSTMDPSSPNDLKMDQNGPCGQKGPKWIKMVQNGLKWSILVQEQEQKQTDWSLRTLFSSNETDFG